MYQRANYFCLKSYSQKGTRVRCYSTIVQKGESAKSCTCCEKWLSSKCHPKRWTTCFVSNNPETKPYFRCSLTGEAEWGAYTTNRSLWWCVCQNVMPLNQFIPNSMEMSSATLTGKRSVEMLFFEQSSYQVICFFPFPSIQYSNPLECQTMTQSPVKEYLGTEETLNKRSYELA